jgi:hypothetical protein
VLGEHALLRLTRTEPLLDVVAWWRREYREAVLNGEDISTADMNEAEGAISCIGIVEELRTINGWHGVPGAATAHEADLRGFMKELEMARAALRGESEAAAVLKVQLQSYWEEVEKLRTARILNEWEEYGKAREAELLNYWA